MTAAYTLPATSYADLYRWDRSAAPAWERDVYDALSRHGWNPIARLEAVLWARALGTLDGCPLFGPGDELLAEELESLLPRAEPRPLHAPAVARWRDGRYHLLVDEGDGHTLYGRYPDLDSLVRSYRCTVGRRLSDAHGPYVEILPARPTRPLGRCGWAAFPGEGGEELPW